MKKLLLAVTVGMLAATAPLTAHASGATFTGGCGFATLNDTTPGGQLGGQDVWNGAIRLAAIATTLTAGQPVPNGSLISANCELFVNGVSQGIVLSSGAPAPVAVAAGSLTFTAAITDIVSMCTNVTTGAGGNETACADATTTQIVPQPVIDAIDMVITALNDNVFSKIDPTICPVLGSLAPGAGPVIIDSTGDTWIGSTDPSDKFWDCPPYDPPVV